MSESEKITPSPVERKEANAMGEDTVDGLIDRVEQLLDAGDGRFMDREDHEEPLRMLSLARMLAGKNSEVIEEIDQLLADIEIKHGKL